MPSSPRDKDATWRRRRHPRLAVGGCATIGGRPVIFDPDSEYAIELRLKALAEKLQRKLVETPTTKKRASRQPPRKQAKPVRESVFAKLRAKFPPRGKPPKEMSTSEVCRKIDLDPNRHWHSVNRALGREPKK